MKNNFDDLLKSIEQVPSDKKYWIVRTMGGAFYKEFVLNGYIAIGYNPVVETEIKFSISEEKKIHELKKNQKAHKTLTKIIESKGIVEYDDKPINASYAAGQLIRFYRDINIGDIIFIPSEESYEVSIGIVESKPYTIEIKGGTTGSCPFNKRMDIKWIRHTTRHKLPPILQLMFSSRHIISNVDNYADHIESFTKDFFTKDDITYLVLRVKKENDIAWKDFTIITDLLYLLEKFADEENYDINIDDIKMKISVQSPGDILMYALSPEGLFLVGLFTVFLTGGQIKIDRIGLDISTIGLVASVSNFLDRWNDRKEKNAIVEKLKNMEIEDPNDLLNFLKEMKNPRKDY